MPGMGEILLIGGIIVFLFGATKIPKLAKSVGEGIVQFKKSVKEAKEISEE